MILLRIRVLPRQETSASDDAAGESSAADSSSGNTSGSQDSAASDNSESQDNTASSDSSESQDSTSSSDNSGSQDNTASSDNSGNQDSSASSDSSDSSQDNSGSSSSAGVATGSLIWPCAGGYISSHFGGRTSPTAGASSNHKGVDIAASTGTAIYAADGGTVVTVSYSSARGNYIVVSHGNGLTTLYQHCSAIYASVGDKVSQGDVIAAVGSTGISTGAHLHFEVWVNGVPVDPENYI